MSRLGRRKDNELCYTILVYVVFDAFTVFWDEEQKVLLPAGVDVSR